MSWVKLATGFPRHPKALAAGPTARHLWFVALCWAGEYNTDGVIPGYALPTLANDAGISQDEVGSVADKLVEVGLWERQPSGWVIHDWPDWQSTTEERDKKLAQARDRKRRWQERVRNASGTRSERPSESESEAESEAEAFSSSTDSLQQAHPQPDDDDSTKLNETLELVADALATSNGKTNSRGYRHRVITNAWADGKAEDIRTLIATHPDRDPTWLADEHLGRPHPPDTCTNCHGLYHTADTCRVPKEQP